MRSLTLTLALACSTALGTGLMPVAAAAQPARSSSYAAMPRISAIEVQPVDRIEPGADLEFTIWGTPGAQAALQIDGTRRPLALYESSPGVYRGTYTVARRDRIGPDSRVTANLRRDNRVTTADLGQPLQADWPSPQAAAVQPQITQVRVSDGGRRDRDLLQFTLTGTPGGHASVQLQGSLPRVLVLDEVSPGEYTAQYRLPAGARLATDRPLVAHLRVGGRVASSSVADAYDRVNLRGRTEAWCAECGRVESVNVVEVDGEGRVVGTVVGGVLGAVVGNQVGHGDGRKVATVVGAVGGALLGREIERRQHRQTRYEVVVRLTDGERKVMLYEDAPPFKVGDAVRIVDGGLELRRG